MIRNVRLVSVVVLAMSCCFVSSAWAESEKAAIASKPRYSWQHTDNSQALLNHGHIVWQLNFDKKQDKPYFAVNNLFIVLHCLDDKVRVKLRQLRHQSGPFKQSL